MILDPVAAYVIKTLDANGDKVFINVCTDRQIESPETLDASEIAINVVEGRDWVVPIVVSVGRTSTDKAGKPCFVVDCCMNPAVVILGIEDPSVKVLTVETCIELVEDRFNKQLSRDYKFPRMKSKGYLQNTEVDLSKPSKNDTEDSLMQDVTHQNVQTKPENQPETKEKAPKIEILGTTQSDFYYHLYRGPYTGPNRPKSVVEIDGEHHNIQLVASTIMLDEKKLDLKFIPEKVYAFYNELDSTTYVMLWG